MLNITNEKSAMDSIDAVTLHSSVKFKLVRKAVEFFEEGLSEEGTPQQVFEHDQIWDRFNPPLIQRPVP